MKILFCGTTSHITTGYSKIANKITNGLAKNHDVFHFAFQALNPEIHRDVHHNITTIPQESFGYDTISDTVRELKPDTIILYNDVIVCSHMVNKFLEMGDEFQSRLILYIDLTYEWEHYIHHLAKITNKFVCFNKSWEKHLIDFNIPPNRIDTFEHPIDLPIEIPTKVLDGEFVILNMNRNSYRKFLDITVDGFIKFFKKNGCSRKLKLFMGCKFTKEGSYDISELVITFSKINGLTHDEMVILMDECVMRPPIDCLSDEDIQKIYASCDVGINTCGGEGFGMCNIEHQLHGKPQILTKIPTFEEIFNGDEEFCKFLEPKTRVYVPSETDGTGGILHIPCSDDVAEALDFYYRNRKTRELHGQIGKEVMMNKVNDWNSKSFCI